MGKAGGQKENSRDERKPAHVPGAQGEGTLENACHAEGGARVLSYGNARATVSGVPAVQRESRHLILCKAFPFFKHQ